MLKVLRDNVKYLSWILWVVIGVFILFVFVDFGGGLSQGGGGVQMAARVGDERVTMTEFQRTYRQLEGQYRQIYGEQFSPELAQQIRLPLQALDQLINQRVLLAEAERMGLAASDEEVRDAILAMGAFKDDKGRFIGDAAYAELLKANDLTVDSFEGQVRDEVLLGKLNDVLAANLYIPDAEVEKAYKEQVEKAKIRYLQLPRNQFLQGQEIPQSEIAAYFQAQKDQYKLPEQREAAYLLVEAAKMFAQVNVPEAELRKYYQDNQKELQAEEQVRARHILVKVDDQKSDEQARAGIEQAQKRIAGGEDFAKVAQEVSEDPASKERGGDLGYFGRGRMVPEFEQAAFSAEPNKLVGPVRSPFGYHLLEVTDKRPGGVPSFEQARPQIQARLAADRVKGLAEAKAKQVAERLAKDEPAGPQDLEAIAKEDPTLTFAATGKFSPQDPIPGIGRSPQLGGAAFALKKGEVSQPIQVPRGWMVLYLTEIHPPRTPELAEVEPKVRLAVAQQKQQRLAMDRLAQAKGEVEQGKTLDQVAAELGLEVKESEEFGGQGMIQGLGYNPQVTQAALALQPNQVGGPVADAQGAVLFQVVERKSWDPQQFKTEREQTRSQLEQQRLSRVLAALIEQRRRELGVEYDRQLLESMGMVGEAGQQG